MELIFLYGPAAVGKLTVGRELSRLTGLKLFHNHLVVDAVGADFDFGTEPFVRLREELWCSVFRETARQDRSLIFTFAPERTVRPGFIGDARRAVESEGGTIRFIELVCPLDELETRVENGSREEFGKLRSLQLFRSLDRDGAFEYPYLPEPELVVDTMALSPTQAAEAIAEHLRSAET